MLGIFGGFHSDSIKEDKRAWTLEKSGTFSTKSYIISLMDDSTPIFVPSNLIWKAKVPSKVKMMVRAVAQWKINTNDVIQKRRPSMVLSPDWCVLCKNASKVLTTYFFTAQQLSFYGPSWLGLLN